LASSSAVLFPRVAHFLAQEMERASVVAGNSDLRGVVRMGSQVRYCDDKTGEVRDVVLVYPHEADITLKRLGSYAGRGCVDRPVGWPSHRV
jgi:regulator of nucleoside diphosphate kinase